MYVATSMFFFFQHSCVYTDEEDFTCNVVMEISDGLAVGFAVAVQVLDFQACILQFPHLF